MRFRKAKSWLVRLQQIINDSTERTIKRKFFKLTIGAITKAPPQWQITIQTRWRALSSYAGKTNLVGAIALFLICAAITVLWGVFAHLDFGKLWPATFGLTLNVFFILIVFEAVRYHSARRQAIEHQREVIDDYKRWDSREAQYRIAGAIRRLNRLNVFDVDLRGVQISDFAFADNGIKDLTKSKFYDGSWGSPPNNNVCLSRVSFSHVNCASVLFSPFDPLGDIFVDTDRGAKFLDCSFLDADLSGTIFNGAALVWTVRPPDSHFENWEDEEGESQSSQISYGPFFAATLSGASFRDCHFENADFRGADGILDANFEGAKGLDEAFFDDATIKAAVLASAAIRVVGALSA